MTGSPTFATRPGFEKHSQASRSKAIRSRSSRPLNSEFPEKRQHAVLWIDDGTGQISAPLDLHPVPEIQSLVGSISDVSADGKVYLAGQLDSRPVVWVVDVATHGVIEHVLPAAFAVFETIVLQQRRRHQQHWNGSGNSS